MQRHAWDCGLAPLVVGSSSTYHCCWIKIGLPWIDRFELAAEPTVDQPDSSFAFFEKATMVWW